MTPAGELKGDVSRLGALLFATAGVALVTLLLGVSEYSTRADLAVRAVEVPFPVDLVLEQGASAVRTEFLAATLAVLASASATGLLWSLAWRRGGLWQVALAIEALAVPLASGVALALGVGTAAGGLSPVRMLAASGILAAAGTGLAVCVARDAWASREKAGRGI